MFWRSFDKHIAGIIMGIGVLLSCTSGNQSFQHQDANNSQEMNDPIHQEETALEIQLAIPLDRNGQNRFLYFPAEQSTSILPYLLQVALVNAGNTPLDLWQENCSFGYANLSFELIWNEKTYPIKKKERSWREDAPMSWEVGPGEIWVISSALTPQSWEGLPAFEAGTQHPVKIRAIYQNQVESDSLPIWVGRIESQLLEVTAIQF